MCCALCVQARVACVQPLKAGACCTKALGLHACR